MHKNVGKALSAGRKLYRKVSNTSHNFEIAEGNFEVEGEAASDLIRSKLLGTEPAMICRFGCFEMNCVSNYIRPQNPFYKNAFDFMRGRINYFWWKKIFENMSVNAGFFPANYTMIERFCKLMLEDMRYVDILGSWLKEESLFERELSQAIKIPLPDLEPFNHKNPWSEALKDKTVLVI